MSFKFEKLVIWQKSMDGGEEIFQLAETFPKKEIYNLISQMRRAVDSVALNISEGSILQSNTEFSKFLSYSIRSVAEVVTCLYKAHRRKYISSPESQKKLQRGFFINEYAYCFSETIEMKIGYPGSKGFHHPSPNFQPIKYGFS